MAEHVARIHGVPHQAIHTLHLHASRGGHDTETAPQAQLGAGVDDYANDQGNHSERGIDQGRAARADRQGEKRPRYRDRPIVGSIGDLGCGPSNQDEEDHHAFAEEQEQGKPVLKCELVRPDADQEPRIGEDQEAVLQSVENQGVLLRRGGDIQSVSDREKSGLRRPRDLGTD